jgi:hypothetical protein
VVERERLLRADVGIFASVHSQRDELERAVLHSNAALAVSQARAILALFEKDTEQTARAALDPALLELAQRREPQHLTPELEERFKLARNFDSIAVFSTDGTMLARYPKVDEPDYLGRKFAFRRYFLCVSDLMKKRVVRATGSEVREPEVCISPAYRGEGSKRIEFTHVAPIRDAAGAAVGFVILNKHAAARLGEIDIADSYRSGQTTAVIGQRDIDRPRRDQDAEAMRAEARKKLTVVAHPHLLGTDEHALDPTLSKHLLEVYGDSSVPGRQLEPANLPPWEDATYVDPVTRDPRLAGFAPVGKTGFVVVVSTPKAEALRASTQHVGSLVLYAGLLNLGFVVLGAVALWITLRSARPAQPVGAPSL